LSKVKNKVKKMVEDFSKLVDIKAQMKKELIDYYDNFSNEIDISTQEILIRDTSLTQYKRNNLVKINELFIKNVKEILDNSCIEIDLYNFMEKDLIHESNYLKKEILKTSCFYISQSNLNHRYNRSCQIGVLVICNWYLDDNEKNFLKYSDSLQIQNFMFYY
jgi:hypothetical protein